MPAILRPLPGLLAVLLATPPMFPLHAQAPPAPAPTLAEDPVLQTLLHEARSHNPDLARSEALLQAERERISQAGALPDPTLSLGLQNDGFKRLEVGRMETSFYSVTASQGLPWPGKRAIRKDIAQLGSEAAQAASRRAQLSLEAEIKRSYLALLLARDQLRLLEAQERFLGQAQALAKTRYEVGQGSQADLLRTQLARTRLAQTRLSLESEEHLVLSALNHMRTMDSDMALETPSTLERLPDPVVTPMETWEAKAEHESPELQAADLGRRQAERGLDLAKLERRPDFAVSAGVMPRGSLDPMWSVGVSITVPLWSRTKQQRSVAEQEWRLKAGDSELGSIHHRLSERIHERSTRLASALASLRLYREGLLVQSEATFQATLAQYESGRVPLLSVLEALQGWIADRSGLLQAQAQAHTLQIALEEMSLGPTPSLGSAALSAAAMGSSSTIPSASATRATSKSDTGGSDGAPAMGSM